MSLERISQLDKFFVQQTFAPLVNKYRVATVADDGVSEGTEQLAFVQQKRMRVREQVDIFADESRQQLLMQLKARTVFEFRGRTDVISNDGTVIAQLQKQFKRSLIRSSWAILDNEGNERIQAREKSAGMAILRRIWGWIPYVGSIPFFIPFDFEISVNGHVIGSYKRIWSLRDRYVMDLSGDPDKYFDRRVAVAFAIALDALQDR